MNDTGLPLNQVTGKMHMEAFTGLRFLGITGNISIDDNNERLGYSFYLIICIVTINLTMHYLNRSYNWFNFGLNYTQSALSPVGYYDGEVEITTMTRDIYYMDGVTKIYDGCMHF